MTAEELKALFSTPLMLLGLMVVGAFGSMFKQLLVARRSGTDTSVWTYLSRVETVITIGQTCAAWLGLLFSDTLNIAAALAVGYVANDAADAWTKEGRSMALGFTQPGDPKVRSHWMLGIFAGVIAIAMLGGLSGCAGTLEAYKSAKSLDDAAYVLTEHYGALVKEAADMKDAGAPAAVVAKLQEADRTAKPIVLELGDAARAYDELKNADTESALQIAIEKTTNAIADFVRVLNEARGAAKSAALAPDDCPDVKPTTGWLDRACATFGRQCCDVYNQKGDLAWTH